jgi:hypothetical protein
MAPRAVVEPDRCVGSGVSTLVEWSLPRTKDARPHGVAGGAPVAVRPWSVKLSAIEATDRGGRQATLASFSRPARIGSDLISLTGPKLGSLALRNLAARCASRDGCARSWAWRC